ncbi:MAG: hypothetical protein ACRC14_01845 [Paracoccaceae bacterium]
MAGEFNEIFSERGMLFAVLGAIGGAVRSAALKTTWREGLRVIFIGGALSFGAGALAPYLLRPWLGELPEDISSTLGVIGAAAFLTGLLGVTIIERLLSGNSIQSEDDNGK